MLERGKAMNEILLQCPYCGENIDIDNLDTVVDYALMLRECKCGAIIDERGKDVTETYYKECIRKFEGKEENKR